MPKPVTSDLIALRVEAEQPSVKHEIHHDTILTIVQSCCSNKKSIRYLCPKNMGEIVLNKHTANIFFGTNFEQLMRFRGVQTILFTGIATEYGVEHSAREAAIRGFYTVVVSDCVSSSDKTAHEMALKIIPRLCLVLPSKDITKEWAA
jgi:isochorismate hydrolase